MSQIFQYSFPTAITFGAGAIQRLPSHLHKLGYKNPLLVTDPVLARLPIIQDCVEQLETNQLYATIFSNIEKNPVKSNVIAGKKAYKQHNCDCIIGFGGGASLDVARAIALSINHDQDLFDYEDSKDGWKLITNKIPYFVTVPTTSGTGSEVGRSAVISDDKTHEKKILFSAKLMARHVFADPELTLALPPHVTAAVGIDALTHNIEAYVAKGFHPMCDGIAVEGVRLIAKSLEQAVQEPNHLEARSNMMAAAMMGAVAFQKGLGVVHSCAHSLSTHKDLHHGLANALMLPVCMKFNSDVVGDKYTQLANAIGLQDRSANGFIDYVSNLITNIGIKLGLRNHQLSESDIDSLASTAINDVCHKCNPKTVTKENFQSLYREAL